MSFCFQEKPAPRVSAALQLLAKISRVIPPASAAIPALVSSGLTAAGAVDAIAAAVAAQTAVVDVPIEAQIAVQTVVRTAAGRPDRDSNVVRAVPVVPGTIVVIAAIPVRRVARNSFPRC